MYKKPVFVSVVCFPYRWSSATKPTATLCQCSGISEYEGTLSITKGIGQWGQLNCTQCSDPKKGSIIMGWTLNSLLYPLKDFCHFSATQLVLTLKIEAIRFPLLSSWLAFHWICYWRILPNIFINIYQHYLSFWGKPYLSAVG